MTAPETRTETWSSVWAVNILGPDDVLPALNRLDAHRRAHKANETLVWLEENRQPDPKLEPYLPIVWAVPFRQDAPEDVTLAEVEAAWKAWERG